jgi:hypothetical protein
MSDSKIPEPTRVEVNPDCVTEPVMPKANLVYGNIVYYLCIASAMICTIGPLIAMMNVDNNVLNPQLLFGAIWEGKDAMGVWSVGGAEYPGGHFWITNLFKGDGFTQLGLAIGGSCAGPALLGSAYYFMTDEKRKEPLWAALSIWNVILIIIAVTGVLSLGH